MDDLNYIINLGFSGTDIWRAITISFLMAMYVRKQRTVWIMGIWALIIDRACWPIAAQALRGADIQTIYASIGALFTTLPENLGIYVVRYMGLTIMIGLFVYMRTRIHAAYQKEA